MAFITYKHSVSAPYAKELFCDTKLHGRILNIDFRTGSVHRPTESQRQPRQGNYNGSQDTRNQNSSHSYQSRNQTSYNNYGSVGQQNGLFPSPVANAAQTAFVAGLVQSPFTANTSSMPRTGIQGYRSSAGNREYIPQYVGLENPPVAFHGGPLINQPDHHTSIDERRRRLLSQQLQQQQYYNRRY